MVSFNEIVRAPAPGPEPVTMWIKGCQRPATSAAAALPARSAQPPAVDKSVEIRWSARGWLKFAGTLYLGVEAAL
jgi:hypothetical protein